MSRLQTELSRLFPSDPAVPAGDAPGAGVRAVVLDVAVQAGWDALADLGRGVQADLDLPGPGIAVNGVDGWQLWFPLAEPVAADQALAFAEGLRRRYLGGVPAHRVATLPPRPGDAPDARRVGAVPPTLVGPERWSAFLSPDLAPLFADEPWLDHPPGPDAQAELLSRLEAIRPAAFQRALQQLNPAGEGSSPAPASGGDAATDARAFLLSVMRDPSVDLRLRIEAAKALLP